MNMNNFPRGFGARDRIKAASVWAWLAAALIFGGCAVLGGRTPRLSRQFRRQRRK